MIVPVIQYLQNAIHILVGRIRRKRLIPPQYAAGHHAEIQTHHQHCQCQYCHRSYVFAKYAPRLAIGNLTQDAPDLLMLSGFRFFHEQFRNGIDQHHADLQT